MPCCGETRMNPSTSSRARARLDGGLTVPKLACELPFSQEGSGRVVVVEDAAFEFLVGLVFHQASGRAQAQGHGR